MTVVFKHGGLRLYLLKLLGESPRHGYEIISLLEDRFLGFYAPSAGTVYPRLAKLEDDGLVEHEETEGRKVYRLTAAGRAELDRHRDELASLEAQLTQSVADLARDVRRQVKESVRDLRTELKQAAREVRRETRVQRRANAPDGEGELRELRELLGEMAGLAQEVAPLARHATGRQLAHARDVVRRMRIEVLGALRDPAPPAP